MPIQNLHLYMSTHVVCVDVLLRIIYLNFEDPLLLHCAFYSLELFPHIQTQTCDACQRYLHVIDLVKDTGACPDVDEIAALPLDVWAADSGYEKITPNLIGI